MNSTILMTFFYAMTGIEILVLVPFMLRFKTLNTAGKWICYYIISSVVFAVGSIITRWGDHNNMWFFSVMNFIQFLILSFFYWSVIKKPAVRNIITALPILVLALCVADFLKFEGIKSYNSISAGVKSGIIIAYGVVYFLQLLVDKDLIERSIYINSLPVFWYNSGIFLYFCSSFLFSISYNLIQVPQYAQLAMTYTLLCINYTVAMIAMILLYIGLSKIKRFGYADY